MLRWLDSPITAADGSSARHEPVARVLNDLAFFRSAAPLTLGEVASQCGAELPPGVDPARLIHATAMAETAGADEVAMIGASSPPSGAPPGCVATRAGACLITADQRGLLPVETVELVVADPQRAFNHLAAVLHPDSVRPGSLFGRDGVDRDAVIHPDARLEPGVTIDPGVVIGPRAEIGAGTSVGANSVIGAGVRIGRDCAIDAQVSIAYALIGDRVILHAGVRVGHGGPNLRTAPHAPRLGRVIIQNDVQIGVNVSVARGRSGDTVIGEGSRIDPLAVIGCDAQIGRHIIVGPDGRL